MHIFTHSVLARVRIAGLVFGTTHRSTSRSISDLDDSGRTQIVVHVSPLFFLRTRAVSAGEPDAKRGGPKGEPRPSFTDFFDDGGELRLDLVSDTVKRVESGNIRLLGWWRLRNRAPLRMSVRDAAITEKMFAWQLTRVTPEDSPTPCLVYALFTIDHNEDQSIHSFTQRFFVRRENTPAVPVPVQIPNLEKNASAAVDAFAPLFRAGALAGDAPALRGLPEVPDPPASRAESLLRKCLDELDSIADAMEADFEPERKGSVSASATRKRKRI